MARVVVIGGSGFIGSNTVDLLLKEGHDVTVADQIHSRKGTLGGPLMEVHNFSRFGNPVVDSEF